MSKKKVPMFFIDDFREIKKIGDDWMSFKKARSKNDFMDDTDDHWLTMLDRESMLENLIAIASNIKDKILSDIYG